MPDKPNILLIAIDSIRADHMSCYGYERQTTPHIDRFAQSGTLFENTFSPHIPTTPAYASMLTGLDCFGTQVVALRHKGPLRPEAPTAAEILRRYGYNTTSIGFKGNPSSRGYDTYIEFEGWGSFAHGRSPKAQNLNNVTIPELERLTAEGAPWFVTLRHMDPHAPYLPPEPYERMFYHGDECDPNNRSMDPVLAFKPFATFFKSWMPPGISDKDYVIAQYDGAIAYMDACIQSIFEALDSMGILPTARSSFLMATMARRSTTTSSGSITMASLTMCCMCRSSSGTRTRRQPACASAASTSTRTSCPRC